MPRVEVQEGHEEVEAKGGDGGHDHVGEDVVAHGEVGPLSLPSPSPCLNCRTTT